MTAANPYAMTPPPPPTTQSGGNRNTRMVAGGAQNNFGYGAGADLQRARQMYQSGQEGQRFTSAQAERPMFDFKAQTYNTDPTPNAGQAIGLQMQGNSLGNVRPANAPAGLGYGRSNALGAVLQHTVTGNEMTDPGMTYVAPPPPPPPPAPVAPPPVAPANPGPLGGTGFGIGASVSGDLTPGKPGGTTGSSAFRGSTQYELAPLRISVGPKAVIGGKLSDGSIYAGNAAVKGTSPQQYAPLIKVAGGNIVHPTWKAWMDAAGVSI